MKHLIPLNPFAPEGTLDLSRLNLYKKFIPKTNSSSKAAESEKDWVHQIGLAEPFRGNSRLACEGFTSETILQASYPVFIPIRVEYGARAVNISVPIMGRAHTIYELAARALQIPVSTLHLHVGGKSEPIALDASITQSMRIISPSPSNDPLTQGKAQKKSDQKSAALEIDQKSGPPGGATFPDSNDTLTARIVDSMDRGLFYYTDSVIALEQVVKTSTVQQAPLVKEPMTKKDASNEKIPSPALIPLLRCRLNGTPLFLL